MSEEIICCDEVCDPTCACSTAQDCDSEACCYQPESASLITLG